MPVIASSTSLVELGEPSGTGEGAHSLLLVDGSVSLGVAVVGLLGLGRLRLGAPEPVPVTVKAAVRTTPSCLKSRYRW